MDWTKTASGVFKKDFSNVEKIYRKMSTTFSHLGREHWGIHCVCRLEFPENGRDTVTAIRQAWKALVLEYPGLSVMPDGLETKTFVALNSQAVSSWVDDTFLVVETPKSADAIIAEAKPKDLPSLYYLPASSELIFFSQHWRTDAIGTCMLLDRLFTLIAQQPVQALYSSSDNVDGHYVSKISPSLEDAAGSPQTGSSSPELQGYARQYIEEFHKKALNTGGLPYKGDATILPGDTSHQNLVFTKESTAALVTACKSRKISVSAAIHTALARTVFSFAPPSAGESQTTTDDDYTTIMAINLRPYLQAPYNTKAHACSTYVASITPTIKRDSSFADATAELTRQYKSWYSEKFLRALRGIYKEHADRLFAPPRLSQPVPPATPPSTGVVANGDTPPPPPPKNPNPRPSPPSGITLSSLGIIEQNLKGDYYHQPHHNTGPSAQPNLHISSFRFGVSMMTRQMLLYVWTFRGKFTLSVDYNTEYYGEEMTREILRRVRKGVEGGVGVELLEV